jgi:hypothetical protein
MYIGIRERSRIGNPGDGSTEQGSVPQRTVGKGDMPED